LTLKGILRSSLSFLDYWLKKEDGHSQQSPFVYAVYKGLGDYVKTSRVRNSEIENFRKYLLQNTQLIEVEDLGAGSKRVNHSKRQVRQIAKFSTSSPKFCTVYQYFCQLTPARYVLELGTCLGISTRYLSQVTQGRLWTIEGSEKILQLAQSDPKPEKVTFLSGDIQELLPELLLSLPFLDFVLIDANHTFEGTVSSFDRCISLLHSQSILIVADIHWSTEMERAWNEIKNHPTVKLTFDFFECGVVFLDYPGPKTHLILDV
jgi:predicted O-methyltransferase YrrM